MSKKRVVKRETIFFPIFEECSKFTFDTYWKSIFINCSKNKFPLNITYDASRNALFIKKDRVILQYPLTGLSSTEIFTKMISIFKTMGNHSTKEIQSYISVLKRKNTNCTTEWKKIRPKRVRENLLFNFIKRESKKHKLTQRETRRLTSVVFVGYQLGEIIHSDIVLKNGEIEKIKCLVIDKERIKIKKKAKTTKRYESVQSNYGNFFSYYDKFLKDISS